MSILETLASLATAKTVAAAAATTLAVGGAAGLTIAQDVADDSAQIPAEVPVGEAAEKRAEQADLGAGNADRDAKSDAESESELTVEEVVPADDEEDGEGRAADVHAALTGDEAIQPGSREFGEAVSNNARSNPDFGRDVADAASQGASADGRARADEARSQRDDAEVTETETEETASDHGQRPEDTPAEQSAQGQDRANTAPHGEPANERANNGKPDDRP
jgi:hypothetical protein